MKRALHVLCAVLCVLLLALPKNAASQCGPNQVAYRIVVDGSLTLFPEEMSWELVRASDGQVVIAYDCGDYDGITLETSDDTVCLDSPGVYIFKAYDDYGDGWNGATFEITVVGTNEFITSGMPDNNTDGDEFSFCDDLDLEAAVSFATQGGITGCTNPLAVNFNPLASVDDGSCQVIPANDSCINAIALVCGDTITGSTELAGDEGQPASACGTTPQAPGVWYTILGDGSTVTASLCGSDYDTRINIYDGTNGCDSAALENACVAGNDDALSCGPGEVTSAVSFVAANGVTYYILVNGWSGNTGNYQLAISCSASCSPLAANDVCAGATPLTIHTPGACVFLTDSNLCSTSATSTPSCDPFGDIRDVWYSFNSGNNTDIAINLDSITTLPKFAIYDACSGADLLCVDEPLIGRNEISGFTINTDYLVQVWTDPSETGTFGVCLVQYCPRPSTLSLDSLSATAAVISWTNSNLPDSFIYEYGPADFVPGTGTTGYGVYDGNTDTSVLLTGLMAETEYDFYVRNLCGASDSSISVGPVSFTTSPLNDDCVNAKSVACDSIITGNTDFASAAGQPISVCGIAPDAPGVWFSIVGTGDDIIASLCNSDYDTRINVYDGTGGCDVSSLETSCVAGNDDSPECTSGTRSEVRFTGQAGKLYYMLVNGWNDNTGDYELAISCEAACAPATQNDVCATAIPIDISPSGACTYVVDSNNCAFASLRNPSCDQFGSLIDVWYSFNTDTNTKLVFDYEAIGAPEVGYGLYDSCGGAQIICGSLDTAGLDTLKNLLPNHNYYLQVYTESGSTGSYTFCLQATPFECPILRDTITAEICDGQSYFFNGANRTATGAYRDTLVGRNSCDSIVTLNLTVKPAAIAFLADTICQGDVLQFNGADLTTGGTYYDTLVAENGCDSVLVLDLVVTPTSATTLTVAVCDGETYLFDGQQLATAGTYYDTLTNAAGCDSVVTLNLSVTPPLASTINASICTGGSYEFDGQQLTTAGVYYDTLQSTGGCDSVVTLNLNVTSVVTGGFAQSICDGASYFFNGESLTQAGIYYDTIPSSGGCDSIITLTLSITPTSAGSISQSICAGSTYTFNGEDLTQAGVYLDTLTGSNGCDSILTLTLTLTNPVTGTIDESICPGGSFTFNGATLTTAGVYLDTLVASSGCDSILTLNLTLLTVSTGTVDETICQGQSFLFNGQTLTTQGAYLDTLTGSNGCDSILTLNLTVTNALTSSFSETICTGQSYTYNGVVLTTGGAYLDTLTSTGGCDSIVTLNLTVSGALTSSFSETICTGQSYTYNGVALTTAGAYLDTLTSTGGCDSIVTLNLTVSPALTSSFSQTICTGQSYTFNGVALTAAGDYMDTLTSAGGCDSVVTLTLTVSNALTSSFSQSICQGQSYTFNGVALTSAGNYMDTLTSSGGCDSIITLTLTVNVVTSSFSQTICTGQSYTFNGVALTTAGNYLDTLAGAGGCDSVVTLTLTVTNALTSSFSQNICAGQSYTFNGVALTAAGTYLDTLTSSGGCDSIITLTLTLNALTSSFSQTICAGQSYTFNGATLTNAGAYMDTLTGSGGCDSIVTLNLTVSAVLTSSFTENLCPGVDYNFNGQIVNQPGQYKDTLTTVGGCDSIVTLNLQITDINDSATVSGATCTCLQGNAGFQWINCATNQPINGANSQTFIATQNGSYACIIFKGGCTDTTNCVTVTIIGVDEVVAYNVSLYPNPAGNSFTITHNYQQDVHVKLVNTLGEVVKEIYHVTPTTTVGITDLAAGVYQVILLDNKQQLKVVRLVKQ